jgi:hypothetical protein
MGLFDEENAPNEAIAAIVADATLAVCGCSAGQRSVGAIFDQSMSTTYVSTRAVDSFSASRLPH